ncbi:MAG: fatty acid cis/trans isomerase, partial [Proteobacteria bacterium]|nr:fatty acid cis/trans isomerase [Pseudomonadota bacterium]
IMGDNIRVAPSEDTLTIRPGVLGSYPGMFFRIDEANIDEFTEAVENVKSDGDYAGLIEAFGIPRTSPRFWDTYDTINRLFRKLEPVGSGALDLTRYELAEQP